MIREDNILLFIGLFTRAVRMLRCHVENRVKETIRTERSKVYTANYFTTKFK